MMKRAIKIMDHNPALITKVVMMTHQMMRVDEVLGAL